MFVDEGRSTVFKRAKIMTALAVPVFSGKHATPAGVVCCYSLMQSGSVPFVLRFVQQALHLLWTGLDKVEPHESVGHEIWQDVGPADLGEMAADVEMQHHFISKKRPHTSISSEPHYTTTEQTQQFSQDSTAEPLAAQLHSLDGLGQQNPYSTYSTMPTVTPPEIEATQGTAQSYAPQAPGPQEQAQAFVAVQQHVQAAVRSVGEAIPFPEQSYVAANSDGSKRAHMMSAAPSVARPSPPPPPSGMKHAGPLHMPHALPSYVVPSSRPQQEPVAHQLPQQPQQQLFRAPEAAPPQIPQNTFVDFPSQPSQPPQPMYPPTSVTEQPTQPSQIPPSIPNVGFQGQGNNVVFAPSQLTANLMGNSGAALPGNNTYQTTSNQQWPGVHNSQNQAQSNGDFYTTPSVGNAINPMDGGGYSMSIGQPTATTAVQQHAPPVQPVPVPSDSSTFCQPISMAFPAQPAGMPATQTATATNNTQASSSGKVCRIQGCDDPCVERRPYCQKHSGNRLCEHDGCTKCAQGSTRFCIAHGGGRRCTFPGCDRGARDKFFCAAVRKNNFWFLLVIFFCLQPLSHTSFCYIPFLNNSMVEESDAKHQAALNQLLGALVSVLPMVEANVVQLKDVKNQLNPLQNFVLNMVEERNVVMKDVKKLLVVEPTFVQL